MTNNFIGLGKCSKKYLYILGTILFRCLRDCIFGFIAIDPESKTGLFGFIPELSKHYLLQDFYKYLSYIIGGLIFLNVLKKNNSLNKEKAPVLRSKSSNTLIYHKQGPNLKEISIIKILAICMIYCIHAELSRIMYLFDFNGLDFWIFDIIFTIFFMDTYFIITYHKHQKFSMIFVIIINAILLIISSFLPNTNNQDSDLRDKNTYQIIEDITNSRYLFICILFIFIFLSALLSYGRVKTKILMYLYYISPYQIIFYVGAIGSILTFLALIFVTFFNCKENTNYSIENYCILSKIVNNKKKYYYDNIFIYFNDLYDNITNYKFYFEILLITPLFFALEFFGFTCEILTIHYLNPIYVLVRENLYYCILRFLFILANINDYNKYMTIEQFFILQFSEISAIFGYAIYLEIIELRFCGLDKDLRRKIIERGERESVHNKLLHYNNNSDENNDNENNDNENNDIDNNDIENNDNENNSFDDDKTNSDDTTEEMETL